MNIFMIPTYNIFMNIFQKNKNGVGIVSNFNDPKLSKTKNKIQINWSSLFFLSQNY